MYPRKDMRNVRLKHDFRHVWIGRMSKSTLKRGNLRLPRFSVLFNSPVSAQFDMRPGRRLAGQNSQQFPQQIFQVPKDTGELRLQFRREGGGNIERLGNFDAEDLHVCRERNAHLSGQLRGLRQP